MFNIGDIDFKQLVGLETRRAKIMYLLALMETQEHSGHLPNSWHGMITCANMEPLAAYTDQELEIFFEAVFGKEKLEKL